MFVLDKQGKNNLVPVVVYVNLKNISSTENILHLHSITSAAIKPFSLLHNRCFFYYLFFLLFLIGFRSCRLSMI